MTIIIAIIIITGIIIITTITIVIIKLMMRMMVAVVMTTIRALFAISLTSSIKWSEGALSYTAFGPGLKRPTPVQRREEAASAQPGCTNRPPHLSPFLGF